jgi:beta-lactamase regulating signal transducer with metallopeptidase domain
MNEILGTFFTWLIRTSWQAGVLTLLVLFIQWLFQERLNARWRYALWSLLLLKLLLPVSPESSMSLFNLAGFERFPSKIEKSARAIRTATASTVPEVPLEIMRAEPRFNPTPELSPVTDYRPSPAPSQELIPNELPRTVKISQHDGIKNLKISFLWAHLPKAGALAWALGVAGLAWRTIRQNLTFLHHLRVAKTIAEPSIVDIFQNCKAVLRIRFPVELLETSQVKSPALHGFFRPKLLLPQQFAGEFSQEELRYIFLHELAHVKRRDMAVHWLGTVLRILHWFNPILWLSFRCMAADRELACDEMALSHAGDNETKRFGQAIIKVLERCGQTSGFPLVMGILENRNQMTRRIATILKFGPRSQPSILAVALLLVLGVLTLTDAKSNNHSEAISKSAPISWQKWSAAAVAKARANGKPVIVDFTADWCLTCQVNRKTSLEIDAVRAKIKEIGAVAFVADYTKEVPEITRELERYKRSAVPLVLVYPADPQAGAIVLPSILKPTLVLDAIIQAARPITGAMPTGDNASDATATDGSPSYATNNALIRQLKHDIVIQRANLETLLERYTENHPKIIQARELLGTLRRNLQEADTTESRSVPENGKPDGISELSEPHKQTDNDKSKSTMRRDLFGNIKGKNGAPVPATVFIFTASPKVGTSTLCPSCYLDCRKSAKTDSKGDFKVESLDPNLLFRILVVANHYEPRFVDNVDPSNPLPPFELQASGAAEAEPNRSVKGRLLDPDGRPIIGAVIDTQGISRVSNIDPLAVTDEDGQFLLAAKEAFQSTDFRVQARAFANKTFTNITSGTDRHDLVMTEGSSVTGRVLYNGKPLPNVSVGMVSEDRRMDRYTGNFNVGTGADGRFSFVNIPADVNYYIYGLMKSMRPYGSITVTNVHSAKDGEIIDIGDLIVSPGYQVAGRVVLADGNRVPPNTQLLLSRDKAWDSIQLTLSDDGGFEATDIPAGGISLSVRIPGYRPSARNFSMNRRLNPNGIIGQIDRNATNLVLLMEKRDDSGILFGSVNSNIQEAEQAQNHPIHGAEAALDRSNEWVVTGRVIDRQSQQNVPHFWVLPGDFNPITDRIDIDMERSVFASNGTYTVNLDKRWKRPAIKVSSPGLLRTNVFCDLTQTTNATLVMQTDPGPAGIVLNPDGTPAAGIDVLSLYADEAYKSAFLGKNGKIKSGLEERIRKTDSSGHFSFPLEWGIQLLVAASPSGFKTFSAEGLAADSKLALEEYGSIRGTLYRDGLPGKGEDLDLAFANTSSMGIQISNHVVTDDQGGFEFHQVPAGELQITSRSPNPGHIRSWSNELLRKVSVPAGQTIEIKINTAPRVPTKDYEKGLRTGQAAILPGVLHGQVLLPNNKPVSAAQVALRVDHRYLLSLGQGTLIGKNLSDGLIVLTDENGNFTLPTCEQSEAIIAVSDAGIGAVSLADFKKSPKIRLQAWSRIEGTLKVGSRLGTNEIVALTATSFENDLLPIDTRDLDVQTDSQGHFEMKFVPPGKRRLSRVVVFNGGARTDQPLADVIIEPAETKHLDLGGVGLAITGKIKFKNAETNIDWQTLLITIRTKRSGLPHEKIAKGSLEERIAYQRTEEYNAMMRNTFKDHHWYPLSIGSDGSFVCHDVLPGNYQFYADEMIPSEALRKGIPKFYWSGEASVLETNDKTDQINLGTVEMTFTRVATQ